MGTAPARIRILVAAAVVAATVVLGATPPAGAATIEVTTTADGGAGSLRDAFAQASAAVEPTEIVLSAGATYALDDCGAGDLAHTGTQPLAIRGNGATIRQTCAGERVIATDGDLTVEDATITGGTLAMGIGGGIEADTADVTLVRSTVDDNSAPIGGGVAAIRVTLDSSTVSGNVAGSFGGGIWADQVASLTNSTVVGNEAGSGGGGITLVNTSVELLFATVVGNIAPVGGNIQLQAGSDDLTSFGSVVADADGGPDCTIDAGATTVSQGANVDGDDTCGFGAGAGDQPGAGEVGLGDLAGNGGPTLTLLPQAGSPLIDGAPCAAAPVAVASDQRGVARPAGDACDIGAVEVEAPDAPPDTTVPPTTTGPPGAGPGPSPAAPAVPVAGAALFTG